MGVFYLESFLLISGISGFSFFAIGIFENLETMENFQKLIFWVIKSIYLISSTFPSIFVFTKNSQKVTQSYQGALTIEA